MSYQTKKNLDNLKQWLKICVIILNIFVLSIKNWGKLFWK